MLKKNILIERPFYSWLSFQALDPAKMNRALLLQRTPPGREDLMKIGRGIGGESQQQLSEDLISNLAEGYEQVCKAQERKKEYFGLRDFYSLVK